MKLLFKVAIIIAALWQVILAIIAEQNEDYTKGIYEILWFFFFVYLSENQESERLNQ